LDFFIKEENFPSPPIISIGDFGKLPAFPATHSGVASP
jgi:hypothetical protein